MRLRVGQKISYDSGPNTTPMVDVVMVILIFLMLTGSFVGSEHFLASNIPIADASAGGAPPPPGFIPDEPIDIRVESPAPGTFFAVAGKIRTSDPDVLTDELRKLREALNATGKADDQIQVKIGPAYNVRYEELVQVYEAAMRAGYQKIAFARAH